MPSSFFNIFYNHFSFVVTIQAEEKAVVEDGQSEHDDPGQESAGGVRPITLLQKLERRWLAELTMVVVRIQRAGKNRNGTMRSLNLQRVEGCNEYP